MKLVISIATAALLTPLAAVAADPAPRSQPGATNAGPSPGPAQAPISTSRSNKKHGLDADAPSGSPVDPAKAPVNTSRSNK